MAVCEVCFRHCDIKEGGIGFCGGRTCREGQVTALNYGLTTGLALDPIEKKPLRRFYPGRRILSYGSFGCNLRCPFCQNAEISWSEEAFRMTRAAAERAAGSGAAEPAGISDTADPAGGSAGGLPEYISPQELADTAVYYRPYGNIGVAFTYNEPLVGYEYIRDTAILVHEKRMKNVIVTNGIASLSVLQELAPYIDAMNIDLKGFTEQYYKETLSGDLQMVLDFITMAVQHCHVELTTLIVPGENDSEEEIRRLASWISELKDAKGNLTGPEIPLHLSRFFPRFHMTDRAATDVEHIYRLADVAREKLRFVYTGNC